LVAPAGCTLWVPVQQQNRLAVTLFDVYRIHYMQISIKFAL
jgi:hypothetical protein